MSVKIFTNNTAQFPFPIGMGNRFHRIDLLAREIRRISPDIVCLQEMWARSARNRLARRLSFEYPFTYSDNSCGKFILGLASGLMILSKYPIVKSNLHHFKAYRGPEHFAKKGVIGVRINVNGTFWNIFTTHLQAGAGCDFFRWIDQDLPPTVIISGMEMAEIRDFIDRFMFDSTDTLNLKMLTGDFNIGLNDDDHEEMVRAIAAIGPMRETYIIPPNGVAEGTTWTDSGVISNSHVDYIWALNSLISGQSVVNDTISSSISDHLCVIGDFTVSLP